MNCVEERVSPATHLFIRQLIHYGGHVGVIAEFNPTGAVEIAFLERIT